MWLTEMNPILITGIFTALATLTGSLASGWWTRRKFTSEAGKFDSESDKLSAEATETLGRTYQQMLENTTSEILRLTTLMTIVRAELDIEREQNNKCRIEMEQMKLEILALRAMVDQNHDQIKIVADDIGEEF